MEFDMIQFKRAVEKRKNQGIFEAKPIGSAIKLKRKELNMTLEEGSEGICSVSYLSKLENNQIECSKDFLDQLKERFGLCEKYNEDNVHYEKDLNRIIDFMIDHREIDEAIIENYKSRHDFQGVLIQMYGSYVSKDEIEFEQLYKTIRPLMSNLNDLEFGIFIYILSDYLYIKQQYGHAFMVIKQFGQNLDIPRKVEFILKKQHLKVAFKLKHYQTIISQLHGYTSELTHHDYLEIYRDIRQKYMEFEAEFIEPNQLEGQMSQMKIMSEVEKQYVLIKCYYHHQHYEKALSISRKMYTLDPRILIYHLMILDQLNQTKDIQLFIEQMPLDLNLCHASKKLIKHLRHKHLANRSQLLKYLREDIIGLNHITDDLDVLEFLMVDTQKIFSSFQYYKEANQTIIEIMPKIKALKIA